MQQELPYYQSLYESLCTVGGEDDDKAALLVIERFLDGKFKGGKHSFIERCQDFWKSPFLQSLPTLIIEHSSFVLALSRCFQCNMSVNETLVSTVTSSSLTSLKTALKYSGCITKKHSEHFGHWFNEIAQDNTNDSFFEVYLAINREYLDLFDDAQQYNVNLKALSCIEVLMFGARYIFEYILPSSIDKQHILLHSWLVINELLKQNLLLNTKQRLNLTELDIVKFAKNIFMSDLIGQPSAVTNARYQGFVNAYLAQSALINFKRSIVDEFCYCDDAFFECRDGRAYLIGDGKSNNTLDARIEDKQLKLNTYWQLRALDVFSQSRYANELIGSAENHEANQLAIFLSFAAELQLNQVYGIKDTIAVSERVSVNVFEALLSMNLTSAFYQNHFVDEYLSLVEQYGNSSAALADFIVNGLLNLGENRFPLTFAKKKDKVNRIINWTVNSKYPKGNRAAAKAIVEFWSHDLMETAKQLQLKPNGGMPTFNEQPMLQLNNLVLQMPWITAFQNNLVAAVNNLRRVGAKRANVKSETQRIEHNLAKAFNELGVHTLSGFHPAKYDGQDAGEIDLICALGGCVLVIEIKSSYIRGGRQEHWLHKTKSLRKAGTQIEAKTSAIQRLLSTDNEFRRQLGLPQLGDVNVTGLIVDTSMVADHQTFDGYLKVSLEEILIALWDDADKVVREEDIPEQGIDEYSLYNGGFSLERLIEILENEIVFS
ncbi:NERD domain-containing protein [Thalassomonas sp. M1454]|uniref:NERD domain-containing protein n=1 Tax=Thalassomonas sp. M1454 TaxID=2594477 RepID=UPI00163D77E9|nr:NERD domain-containing protein [Thalassomonas sp. M1454]